MLGAWTKGLGEDGFINDIDGGPVFWPKKILNDNTLIDYADTFKLIQHLNKNQEANKNVKDRKKADKFQSLVKQLTETSNPVLIILKQKL